MVASAPSWHPSVTCFEPWTAYKAVEGGITLVPRAGYADMPIKLPCGQCIGCRTARSKEWAVRINHEAKLHESNCFVTLTYSDECLPEDFSVSIRAVQLFMKRLRKLLSARGIKVRFFACGEYGEDNYRPHYHIMIFGYDFPDKSIWRRTGSGHYTYVSKELQQLWPLGFSDIGNVTFQSAAYVARYILKKVTGAPAEEHYRRVHPITGEEVVVRPEFILMSTKPGIGSSWFERFQCDAFPSDFLIVDGKRVPVPRYYKKKLEAQEEASRAVVLQVLTKRKSAARERAADNTPDRLKVREEVMQLKVKRLRREME